MQELQVIVNQSNAVISANFEELKEQLNTALEEYKDLVYTDETITIARTDVANLRKFVKAVDDKRKEVKKAHMIPYEEFESKAKELVKIINDTIEPIEKQISEYSEKKKLEKKEAIKEYFNSVATDVPFLAFEDVFNSKWISNMSTSMKSIKSEIDAKIEQVKSDMKALEDTGSDAVNNALSMYRSTKDLARSMQVINAYEKNKAEVLAREEARKREEEERKALEEKRRQEAEERRRIEEENRRIEEARRQAAEEERKRIEEAMKQKALESVATSQQEETEGFYTSSGFDTGGFETEGFQQEETEGFDTTGFAVDEPEEVLEEPQEEVVTVKYMVKGTAKQHEDIRNVLSSMNIKFMAI